MNAGQIVLQPRVQLAHALLGHLEKGSYLFGKDHTRNQDQRDREAGDQRQLPVDREQDRKYAGEGHQIGDQLRDDMGVEQFKISGIVHHPAHQVARLLVMEKAEIKALQPVIQPPPQISHQVPGRLVGQVVAQEPKQHPQQIQAEQDQGEGADHGQGNGPRLHHARQRGKHPGRRQIYHGQSQRGQDRRHIQ